MGSLFVASCLIPFLWIDHFRMRPNKLLNYIALMRLNKPIGILLLLWPTLWALWIAGNGSPDWFVVAIFTAGVVIMRSAGCVINDYADRHIDGHVERTQHRPIPAGLVTPKEALILFSGLCLLAFLLVLQLNYQTILLSFVGAFLAASYPFMKRLTHFPQIYLGAAFGWAIPMSFMALNQTISVVAWWLFFLTLIWAVIYDTMYAMVDREDDLKIGVKSTAVLFMDYDRLIIGVLQCVFIVLMFLLGRYCQLGYWFSVGVLIASLLFCYQQWLIRKREKKNCFNAFLNNHWLGAAIFFGIVMSYY
jgi:4-hydroxybenzoate polyprenyltransferase